MSLITWELWMGVLICAAVALGSQLIISANDAIVTVFDFSGCYATPPVAPPCERVAYRIGTTYAALIAWCGLLLLGVAAWFLWELWSAVAPKPITDDFLQLLDDSFSRDWRRPRTWPWARLGWAYGFTLIGAVSTAVVGLLVSNAIASSRPAKPPTVHVDTSQRFRSGLPNSSVSPR